MRRPASRAGVSRRTMLKWSGLGSMPLVASGVPLGGPTQNQASGARTDPIATTPPKGKKPIDIGQTVQLFFDYTLTEMLQDLTQVMHRPVRYYGNPLIRRDRPWEGLPYLIGCAGNVLYSPGDRLFRLWYEDLSFDHQKFLTDSTALTWDYMFMHYLYAQSEDGIHWEKPALNVIPDWGPNTNVVLGSVQYGKVHSMTILDDPKETEPAKRFKALYVLVTAKRDDGGKIAMSWSPDGIHWTHSPKSPQFGSVGAKLGDVLVLSFDPVIGRYVLLTRHPQMGGPAPPPKMPRTRSFISPVFPWNPARESRRRIYRTESDDLLNWDELEMVLGPDDEDNWDDTYFCMFHFRRGDLFIGGLQVFHTVENSWNVQLAFSHDGRRWKHVAGRRPFLDYGSPGSWDRWCVGMMGPPIIKDDEMWFYYGGAINHHDYWFSHDNVDLPEARDINYVDHGMGVAKLRLDGFISASAYLREGIMVTRPVRSNGSNLIVNCACRNLGYLAAELTNLEDKVLPGYSRADCAVFKGDSVNHTITWHGQQHLADATRGIKIRFYLRDADLYSFRIADE